MKHLKNAQATKVENDSGIQEERGESTCSSKGRVKIAQSDGTESGLYPRLRELKDLPETRNSCQIIESHVAQHIKLEGAEKLKMPPVSSAFPQRRTRKSSAIDTLNGSVATGVKTSKPSHISESQKRIRSIIDKNNQPIL